MTKLPPIKVRICFRFFKGVAIVPVVDYIRFEIFAIVLYACQEMVLVTLNRNACLLNNLILPRYFGSTIELIIACLELEVVHHLVIISFYDAWQIQFWLLWSLVVTVENAFVTAEFQMRVVL